MRKMAGLTAMMLLALLLAACGSDDDGDATEVATTAASVATEASTEAAVETATEAATAPATESSPVATAVAGGMATPASAELPASVATPMASPVGAIPAASPVGAIAPAPAPVEAADATPAAAEVTLTGRVELAGAANEAWVMTSEGCVGLGANASLKPGQQLVVRDAEGAIVGVTMIAASDERDACSWDFSLTVPESPFYAVSVPMAVERVFTLQEIEQDGGEIVVPAG